ncbi:PucR family transcriptional regulator [Paenibacillus sp. PL91]|uniref:PucR family transcriptional regulator n=1 Tax=Paenibacillus sp. PL91 TaxID=2729538 RepID=UPI00145F13BF|nr:PucR family transcriptional regulator [Paenibacillus sp. PL91]MBC9201674.1 PucR family transcriptional regulator ligand-binding domain-containing protein [Paenibacillus sp. PL91]
MLLEQLLSNPIFAKSQMIAGHSGLSRTVQTVNIMDAPDIIHFLRPGELLLTNGYFMKEKPETLLELMTKMDQLKCSGLAVKTKRFALDIPQEVIDEANRIHFPIIEISSVEHSLGEILQRSTSIILDNKNDELQYSLTIHKQFSAMIMKGNGIPEIITALTQLLSSPILLLSSKLQATAYSHHFKQPSMQSLISAAESVLRGIPAMQAPVQLCLLDPALRKYRHIELYPIFTYRHEGYLIAFQPKQAASNQYGLTLEQASNVIGMEMTKRQAVKERSRRYKNEFFSDLIDGFIGSEQEALHRGKKYGLKPQGTWLLIAARKDEQIGLSAGMAKNAASSEERLISERDVQYELIKRQFLLLGVDFVMFTKNDLFGMLLFIQESKWEETVFLKQLAAMTLQLHEQSQLSISLGIGNPVTNVLDIGLSYNEAVKALQIGYQMKKTRFVQSYQSKDISYLFRMIPYDELKQFYEETFQCFSWAEENEQKELMRTLNVFYDTQCQLVETSKQLFVHRNTVIYRLDKCEKLMGIKLKDPVESLRFRIAFAIEPLLRVGKSDSIHRETGLLGL